MTGSFLCYDMANSFISGRVQLPPTGIPSRPNKSADRERSSMTILDSEATKFRGIPKKSNVSIHQNWQTMQPRGWPEKAKKGKNASHDRDKKSIWHQYVTERIYWKWICTGASGLHITREDLSVNPGTLPIAPRVVPTVISAVASTWTWGPRIHGSRTVDSRRHG